MDEKIIFAAGTEIGFLHQASVTYLSSQYLKNYNKNRQEIKDRHAWKTNGTGAQFIGTTNPLAGFNEDNTRATINGVTFINNGEQIAYSISVDQFSGLFIKNPKNNNETEGHVIHDTRVGFLNLDYNPVTNQMAVSMHNSSMEKNIAVLDITNGYYRLLTEGESIDENPSWGRSGPGIIYYDSAGIGRNDSGAILGYSPKIIYRLDLNRGDLNELICIDKHDCFMPKEDSEGNIYFIKKPVGQSEKKFTSLKDLLLIPVKISKAIYNWVEFFTMRYTGETFTTSGPSRAKSKENDPQQVFINGNLINVAKTLKENELGGEKFPGIVPRNWELMKMTKHGDIVRVKKGVLDYDINSQAEIIYSNGKYLIKLFKDGKEEVLGKADLATKIKVCN